MARKDDYYTLDVAGQHKRYNVDRLKPHYELNHILFGRDSVGEPQLTRYNKKAPRKQSFQELLEEYNPDQIA